MRVFVLLFLLVPLLASCASSAPHTGLPEATTTPRISLSTSSPIPTATVKPTTWYTPSPRPPLPVFIIPNAAHLKHWKEYEEALARALKRATPHEIKVFCEWIILGYSEQATYVWALCAEDKPKDLYPGVSVPAAIYVGAEGEVIEVKVPEPGGPFVRDIFPEDVQEKIFRAHNAQGWLDVPQLKAHLIYRFEHPEVPPLVVLSATPYP